MVVDAGHVDIPTIFDAYKKSGDYGTAVEALLKEAILTLPRAFDDDSSASMTIDVVYECDDLHQNLRIGVGSKSVVMALAHSFADADADKPSLQPWVASVAAAYSQRPIFEDLVETLGHVLALPSLDAKAGYIRANAAPKPGTPVQTMLGYPVSTLHQ
ncbi:hypothetical protein DYB26_011285, partial [Aphanomyces astaci]